MSSIESMPLSLNATSVMPERVKTCAMLTMFSPWSRVASRLSSQSMPNSAWPPSTTCSGTMSGPPGLSSTSRHSSVVVALLLRRVVAGELRLGHPLELERDRVGAVAVAAAARVAGGRVVAAGLVVVAAAARDRERQCRRQQPPARTIVPSSPALRSSVGLRQHAQTDASAAPTARRARRPRRTRSRARSRR